MIRSEHGSQPVKRSGAVHPEDLELEHALEQKSAGADQGLGALPIIRIFPRSYGARARSGSIPAEIMRARVASRRSTSRAFGRSGVDRRDMATS